jgi:hypothetical protein
MGTWQTPKTNWGQPGQTVPGADDFNRIEGNIRHLQDTKETLAGAQAKAEAAAGAVQAELNSHTADNAPHGATSSNIASRIVKRDASGNFSAGTITANLNGSADKVDGIDFRITNGVLEYYNGTVWKQMPSMKVQRGTVAFSGKDAKTADVSITSANTQSAFILCHSDGYVSRDNYDGVIAPSASAEFLSSTLIRIYSHGGSGTYSGSWNVRWQVIEFA